jgi:hypothetical protein
MDWPKGSHFIAWLQDEAPSNDHQHSQGKNLVMR